MAFVATSAFNGLYTGNLVSSTQNNSNPPTVFANPTPVTKIDPFSPEATVPMPYQLDDQFGPFSTSVWKRNERERHRVKQVNEAFENLRDNLPVADVEKRISKVDTLRLAIRYIRHLDAVLDSDSHIYRCQCFAGFREESEGNVAVDTRVRNDSLYA